MKPMKYFTAASPLAERWRDVYESDSGIAQLAFAEPSTTIVCCDTASPPRPPLV